eukprot:5463905-Ditylum_brightwellii.AAC.1
MTTSDIPNLPLPLLCLQGTDVKLKGTIDCLDALPQILVKAYEPFVMSRFHYGVLLSVVGDCCWYKQNHEVVIAALNENLDEKYLTIQCSKRALASNYSIKPLQLSKETFAPYVEKKRGVPTTITAQGTTPENTHVTTQETTPKETTDNVQLFYQGMAFTFHTGKQKSTR